MSSLRSNIFIDPDRVRGPSVDDITKKMEKGSIQDAYMNFNKNIATYQPYSVLMFPEIAECTDISRNVNFENFFNKILKEAEEKVDISPPFVAVEKLKKIMHGIYEIDKVLETAEYSKKKLEEFMQYKPSFNVPEADEWNYCVEMVENLFKNSDTKYAYMRDLLYAPEETGNMLENLKSHISIEENPQLKTMPGINSSMHYVGEKGSFTPFHVEDGGLSSINLLKSGGPKVWIIIPYQFQSEVEASFADHFRKNQTSTSKSTKKGKEICKDILQHKIYLITPKLLSEWNVPYSIVIQRPGDLFFIRTGTYHAVINMELNIAEAINFGCDKWTSSYQPVPCNCSDNLRTEVQQDRRVIISYNKCKKKMYQCDFGCEELFLTKRKMKNHEKMIHKVVFTCAECCKAFKDKRSLIRHLQTHHVEKKKKMCQICKKEVLDVKQHIRRIHQKLTQCEKCKKRFYSHRINQHKQKCSVVCPVCNITCSNSGYLKQHMNRKHPHN